MAKKRRSLEEYEAQDFQEEDIYSENGREDLLDSDGAEDWEVGFMEGYEE